MESIEQTFNGMANFGCKSTVSISRNGDLVNRAYLQASLPAIAGAAVSWTRYPGHALILNVEVEIGGQRIENQQC